MVDNGSEDADAFSQGVSAVRDGADPLTEAGRLYKRLTDSERLDLLDGDRDFWPGFLGMITKGYNLEPYVHGAVPRLGIPGLRFSDGPRGVVLGRSTAFPVSIARGATWDPHLEEQVGVVIGKEARAQGANFFGGVCINLPRHPAWGRVQETYGEEPVLLGEMGAALVRGVQRQAMACVKHYGLNSMENARFSVDVTCDEATLHEVFLAHFRRVVEEGVAAVMTAYNSVNGEWCGENGYLLEQVLREDWGFQGVTVSDFVWGFRDAAKSLRSGLDVEEPFRQQRGRDLGEDLESGRVTWQHVERAGLRTLAAQLRSTAAVPDEWPAVSLVAGSKHRALAREVAGRAMVLLRNEPVSGVPLLPLDRDSVASLAVIGRLADLPNTGDQGSSNVRPPDVVTPLDGLRSAMPDVELRHVPDGDLEHAVAAAAACDVAVVVVGYTAADEGEFVSRSAYVAPDLAALYPPTDDEEAQRLLAAMAGSPEGKSMVGGKAAGGDRLHLTLRRQDEELIRRVVAANPRTVVVLVTAGAVLMESWRSQVPALLVAWYAGMEGGAALADVLLGDVDPSGRLPFSIPTTTDHLPAFDRDATSVVYDRWFGQRLLDRLGVEPAYPLGFGLSYTAFRLADADVTRRRDTLPGEATLDVHVDVTNEGIRDGRHVVQVYGMARGRDTAEPQVELLLGFASVEVAAGATRRVHLATSLRPLSRWEPHSRSLVAPAGELSVRVASFAGDPDAPITTVAPKQGDHG